LNGARGEASEPDERGGRGELWIPEGRVRDIVRAALMARKMTEEEMLLAGLAWMEEALEMAALRAGAEEERDSRRREGEVGREG